MRVHSYVRLLDLLIALVSLALGPLSHDRKTWNKGEKTRDRHHDNLKYSLVDRYALPVYCRIDQPTKLLKKYISIPLGNCRNSSCNTGARYNNTGEELCNADTPIYECQFAKPHMTDT